MKKIQAMIRPERLEAVLTALLQNGYEGIYYGKDPLCEDEYQCGTVHGVGRSMQDPKIRFDESGNIRVYPKTMIELIVENDKVDDCRKTICNEARNGKEQGEGKIFIYEIEAAIDINEASVESLQRSAA